MRVVLLGGGTIARLVLEHVRREGIPGVEIAAVAGPAGLGPRRLAGARVRPAARGRARGAARAAPQRGGRSGVARRGARAPGAAARSRRQRCRSVRRRARRRCAAAQRRAGRRPLRRAVLRPLGRHRRPRCPEDRLPGRRGRGLDPGRQAAGGLEGHRLRRVPRHGRSTSCRARRRCSRGRRARACRTSRRT